MTLEHIGQKLKSARDNLGLSLSQIHERTKIPFNHLQAIDNGQTDDLPEPVYVSGFIKRYAECVGLNGQQLSDEYREDLDTTPHTNGRFSFLSKGLKDQQPVPSAPPQYFNRTKIDQPPPNLLKSIPFYAFWVIVVMGLVMFLASRQQSGDSAQQDSSLLALKDSATRYNSMQPAPVPPTDSGNVPPAAPTPAATSDAKVTLNASQHVYVEVKSMSSGETKFTGYLESGERRDYQDPEGLRIQVNNGGLISVETDGKVQSFGESGKKSERTFLSKTAKAEAQPTDGKPAATATSKTSATANAQVNAAATAKKVLISKKAPLGGQSKPQRKAEGAGGGNYMPGESLGRGNKGMDVPYRYSE